MPNDPKDHEDKKKPELHFAGVYDPTKPMDAVIGLLERDSPSPTIPGSKTFPCAFCQSPVWISPTGQNIMRSRNAHAACILCVQERSETEDMTFSVPNKETLIQDLAASVVDRMLKKERN